ncbi:MAG: hypothetical protein U5R14_07610 [Gemmatimonadota bacterium]|nr:hypothetical protein [Gemmatimonadota bacterium]
MALAPALAALFLVQACGADDSDPTGPDPDPDPDPATDVTVEGMVTERGTDEGVNDATVSGVRLDTDEQLFEVATDASGAYEATFEITDEPDEVRVEVVKEKLGTGLDSLAFSETITADFELAWGSPFSDPLDEDCLDLDPENVEIEEFGERWRIVDGDSALLLFDEFEAAQDGRDIIQSYGFTEHCFVNRPDAPMKYWLIDGTPPTASDDASLDKDCLDRDPENVEIEEFGEQWRLVDGESALLVFDELEAAQAGRDIIQFYGFTRQCFVDRPDPPMEYWTR